MKTEYHFRDIWVIPETDFERTLLWDYKEFVRADCVCLDPDNHVFVDHICLRRPVKVEAQKTPRKQVKKVSGGRKRSHNTGSPKLLDRLESLVCGINDVHNELEARDIIKQLRAGALTLAETLS